MRYKPNAFAHIKKVGESKDFFWESVDVKDVLAFGNVPPCLALNSSSHSVIHATVRDPTKM